MGADEFRVSEFDSVLPVSDFRVTGDKFPSFYREVVELARWMESECYFSDGAAIVTYFEDCKAYQREWYLYQAFQHAADDHPIREYITEEAMNDSRVTAADVLRWFYTLPKKAGSMGAKMFYEFDDDAPLKCWHVDWDDQRSSFESADEAGEFLDRLQRISDGDEAPINWSSECV